MASSWNVCVVFLSTLWYVASHVNIMTTLLFAISDHPLKLMAWDIRKCPWRNRLYWIKLKPRLDDLFFYTGHLNNYPFCAREAILTNNSLCQQVRLIGGFTRFSPCEFYKSIQQFIVTGRSNFPNSALVIMSALEEVNVFVKTSIR